MSRYFLTGIASICLLGLLACVFRTPAPATVDVFPGARGFGTKTPAGRSGQILKVTHLDDSGPGSLRAAVEADGPRVIVFEVSGRICLESDLVIEHPFCTIAGQTAPSPGIMITGRTLAIRSHDVLIQHLSIRVGDEDRGEGAGRTADCIQITGNEAYNVVLDHLSASWAVDELVGIGYGARDITLSNCLFAEPLNRSIHPKGPHGYGILIADGSTRISLIGNLLAHASARMPRIQGATVLLVNNVFYNKGGTAFATLGSGKGQPTFLTAIGNLFLDGPDGVPGRAIADVGMAAGSYVHQRDNAYPGGVIEQLPSRTKGEERTLWIEELDYLPDPGSGLKEAVARRVGARPADRDSVDRRIIADFLAGRGAIIDSQSQVGGWPELPTNRHLLPLSTDADKDDDGDGYTNIEEVLHAMADQVEVRFQ